jgi:hypothetical protein
LAMLWATALFVLDLRSGSNNRASCCAPAGFSSGGFLLRADDLARAGDSVA